MKKWYFFSILATLIVAFTFLPPLEGINTKNPIERQNEIQQTLDRLRAEIAANGGTYTVAVNPAVQYSLDQLCSIRHDLLQSEIYLVPDAEIAAYHEPGYIPPPPPPPPPPSVYTGYYTPVKNQLSCGSCWAFATCAQFETAIKKKLGLTMDLSEQFLVSCNSMNYSCSGGWIIHDMHADPGARLESCIPYTATNSSCPVGGLMSIQGLDSASYVPPPCDSPCCSIQSWSFVYASNSVPSTTSIKNAIMNYGGVSAYVYVNTAFQYYSSGTFNSCQSYSINHAIQLIGWDDSKLAWRLKNSWGTGWGESGFMWIKYGCSKVGYGASYVVY